MTICRFFYLLAGFCLISSSSLLAELKWEQTEIVKQAAFGQSTLEAKYLFKNTGETSVKITDVVTSCGCTYAATNKSTIAPGEAGEVAVFFETEKREGPQRSTIEVFTNEDGPGVYKLTFVTDVPAAASLPTRIVRWEEGVERTPQKLIITVQPGVTLKLLQPKVPLPVTAQLVLIKQQPAEAPAPAKDLAAPKPNSPSKQSKKPATPASDDKKPAAPTPAEKKGTLPTRTYELTITPTSDDAMGAGLLPIEATWANSKTRQYQIYVQAK